MSAQRQRIARHITRIRCGAVFVAAPLALMFQWSTGLKVIQEDMGHSPTFSTCE